MRYTVNSFYSGKPCIIAVLIHICRIKGICIPSEFFGKLPCKHNTELSRMFTSANSRNSVRVQRLNSVGSLVWEGGDFRYAVVEDIPTTHQLYENDTIVTSGLANDFPEGIAVGYIESFESESGSGFYKIKVRLATDFNNLSHVYIVDNHFKAEQDSLMKMTKKNDE